MSRCGFQRCIGGVLGLIHIGASAYFFSEVMKRNQHYERDTLVFNRLPVYTPDQVTLVMCFINFSTGIPLFIGSITTIGAMLLPRIVFAFCMVLSMPFIVMYYVTKVLSLEYFALLIATEFYLIMEIISNLTLISDLGCISDEHTEHLPPVD